MCPFSDINLELMSKETHGCVGADYFSLCIEASLCVSRQLAMHVDFKLHESYTPSRITIRAGDDFHNFTVLSFFSRKKSFSKVLKLVSYCRISQRLYMLIGWFNLCVKNIFLSLKTYERLK
jgi:hypothetical protein